jgi:3-isopropylmalate/(R)-2-methylmalate dehydratase large subunit
MRINYSGELGFGVTAKDLILATIGRLGVGGMQGYAVEYAGEAIRALSMENRMTICNMTIEGGGRAGMVAPDERTFDYVRGKPGAPDDFDAAVERWRQLPTDDGASFDTEVEVDAAAISPMVTWGTTPGMVVQVTDAVPDPDRMDSPADREAAQRALAYMDLRPGTPMTDIPLDRIFIGSCTKSRISDLREAASVVDGRKISSSLRGMVVPGSQQVKADAEAEGLDDVFRSAGFEWRESGCFGLPSDESGHPAAGRALRLHLQPQLRGPPGRRRANPPGQPKMAAAAAVEGRFVDIREWTPAMDAIEVIEGKVAVLDRHDVDTDQIMPKQFLKRTERTGYGEFLFYDWFRSGEISSRHTRSWSRAGTSARDRPASTPSGASRTTASTR